MSDFYAQNDYRNYLQHHGIKGMHWGEQNGPPYPLSTKVHNMVIRGKQKRAAKRRSKIMHDPAKLYKHREEFSKEEIDAAVAKIQSANRAKELAPKKPKKPTMAEKRAAKKSEKKIKKYSSIKQLEKNSNKLTTDEISKALERIGKKQEIFNKKMTAADQPRKVIELGSNYIKTTIDAIKNIASLKKTLTKENPRQKTFKEEHLQWLQDQGLFNLMTKEQIQAYNEDIKTSDKKTQKIKDDIIKQYESTISDLTKRIEKLEPIERAQAVEEYLDEATESWGNTSFVNVATTKVNNIADKIPSEFDYMLQRGFFDEDVTHSDLINNILSVSFSDIQEVIK